MKYKILLLSTCLTFFTFAGSLNAASLQLSPNTGVYALGSTFTTKVVVNTSGQPINAAEGSIKYNPQELSVVSIDKTGSIFNLWVTEPTFSNSAGTISFSGGLPSGYTGSAGTVFNITFRTLIAGPVRISYVGGAVLANDGKGTNVLESMNGGTYTVQTKVTEPIPEVIEYVAPANTPGVPKIVSDSRGESEDWSSIKNVTLKWQLPSGVTSVRTGLDSSASTIPTKVYENSISQIELSDLEEGISYFHLQFKNEEGWGKVLHYSLKTDTERPESITISLVDSSDSASPVQTLKVEVKDKTSKVIKYKVKIDSEELFEYLDTENSGIIVLPELLPGYHSLIIEAFDQAGNSIVGSAQVTIQSFDKPVFTDYPNEINEEVIPVIKGSTRADSKVEIELTKLGSEPVFYTVQADSAGVFIFIPEGTFTQGVYEISARATDKFGAMSDMSEKIRIAVQQPGYLQIGSVLISVLSVIVPLIAMSALLIIGLWALFLYLRRFRRKVSLESKEAFDILVKEFAFLDKELSLNQAALTESKKTKKLTKAENDLFINLSEALKQAQNRVEKEIKDVENLVSKANVGSKNNKI